MDGSCILHVAAACAHVEVTKLLLENGADINLPNSKNARTALHYACKKGSLEMVEFLVDNGADVHCVDINGQTPLHQ